MQVLVIGGGGREHALSWKCAQSPQVRRVFVAPGNAGTALEEKTTNVAIAVDDFDGLIAFAKRESIELTIVGPEGPLVAGIVDRFAAAGLPCFGPRQNAARLEGSKAYTKDLLHRYGIPTAKYATFTRADFDPAYIRAQRPPIVIKADGLAAGKGVLICDTHEAAIAAATAMFAGSHSGAGERIVVEEFLSGEEVSFIVLASDQQVLPLATSQDHKRRGHGALVMDWDDALPTTAGRAS